jgi:hypothetical protein
MVEVEKCYGMLLLKGGGGGATAKNSFAEFFFWSYGACSAAIEAMLWIRYGS